MIEFADICLITKNVQALSSFYEKVFETKSQGDQNHTFLALKGLNLIFYNTLSAQTDNPKMDYNTKANNCIYIGLNCEDATTEYERIKNLNLCDIIEPRIWPWGAKSFYFNDPDGNRIVVRSWPKEEDN